MKKGSVAAEKVAQNVPEACVAILAP